MQSKYTHNHIHFENGSRETIFSLLDLPSKHFDRTIIN